MIKIDREKGREVSDIMRDPKITAKAKGVFAYLMSLEGEDATVDTIVGDMHEQVAAVRKAIHELERAGYLMRVRKYDSSRPFYDWVLQL